MHYRYYILFFPIVLLIHVFAFSFPAYAHKVYVFSWAEGEMVYTESYSGDKKINNGLIKVYSMNGDLILEGKTDENGLFSFLNPGKGELKIVLEAGMGHRAECTFEDDEVESEEASDSESGQKIHPDLSLANESISRQEIKDLMEEVVGSRLHSISSSLARLEQKRGPGLTEILGGIGYIFGIMGIILYVKSRREP